MNAQAGGEATQLPRIDSGRDLFSAPVLFSEI